MDFPRLTSVTLAPRQVYRGGNVDFVIHTREGVVSVAPLSFYQGDADRGTGGEDEGMLDIDAAYRVRDVLQAKEDRSPSADPETYPVRTIVLDEL